MSETESHPTENGGKTFSEDYVKSLREESASYRTKVRDLEVKLFQNEVKGELQSQGIKAEAKWVEVKEGESVQAAVARFKDEYPHLVAQPEPTISPLERLTKRKVKVEGLKPTAPSSQEPVAKNTVTSFNTSTVNELKKDPKARADIREYYREMLRNQGHRNQ